MRVWTKFVRSVGSQPGSRVQQGVMTLYQPQTQNKLIRGLNKVDYFLCNGLLQTITQGASYLLDAQFSLCILSINTSSRHDLIDVVTSFMGSSGDYKNIGKCQRIECKRVGIELVRLAGVGCRVAKELGEQEDI